MKLLFLTFILLSKMVFAIDFKKVTHSFDDKRVKKIEMNHHLNADVSEKRLHSKQRFPASISEEMTHSRAIKTTGTIK